MKDIIDPVIQRNAYFAHPENLLIAMLLDEQESIRKQAMNCILQCRKNNTKKGVRKFVVPKLNFNAKHYTNLIDWNKTTITEPPLTKNLNYDQLMEIVTNPKKTSIFKMPCHTQSVERGVKLVSEASRNICGPEARHGFIVATQASRQKMSKLASKKDFVL